MSRQLRVGLILIDIKLYYKYILLILNKKSFYLIKSFLKGKNLLFFLVLLLFLLVSGCDINEDKSVTGTFFYRETGDFENITVSPDSVKIGEPFQDNVGGFSTILAGQYDKISVFSLLKFPITGVSTDSLVAAILLLDVKSTWKKGLAEFELFETITDWSDTSSIDPDRFLPDLGTPLDSYSDTSSALSSIVFEIDSEIIKLWADKGAFLIKSSDTGNAMVSFFSDDSAAPPVLKLVSKRESGILDTTFVNCNTGTYYLQTGIDEGKPFLSEGNASGFVMNISIPDSIPLLAVINRCILPMTISESIIAESSMEITIYQLLEKFTTIKDVNVDNDSKITIYVGPDEDKYDLNITHFMNSWLLEKNPNFGLLFRPDDENVTPNQLVFVASDSLSIAYSSLPEIK